MDATEKRIIEEIDAKREEILAFARDIYTHAELGYKEFRTSGKFLEKMEALKLPVKKDLAVTGVKAYLNPEKKDRVSLALVGELDALRIPDHAFANPETQAAHCCGHHTQMEGRVSGVCRFMETCFGKTKKTDSVSLESNTSFLSEIFCPIFIVQNMQHTESCTPQPLRLLPEERS